MPIAGGDVTIERRRPDVSDGDWYPKTEYKYNFDESHSLFIRLGSESNFNDFAEFRDILAKIVKIYLIVKV